MTTHRLAFVSDVHADVHALRDALEDAEALGCTAVICVGDIVDCGLFPDETIALLQERRVASIRGNHDRWACDPERRRLGYGDDVSKASRAWLATLPTEWRATLGDVAVLVTHASLGNDMAGIDPEQLSAAEAAAFLAEAQADVMIVGHTHESFVHRVGARRLIANPGALLRDPASGGDDVPAPGTFGVLTVTADEVRFDVHVATRRPAFRGARPK